MNTRRNFVRGLSGLGAIVATGHAPAIVKSMIAARGTMLGGEKAPTAKSYVQDGLIAMWDGIENAGWGTHDASATVWKDLAGNGYDLTVGSKSSFSTNSLDYTEVVAKGAAYRNAVITGVAQMEICCNITSKSASSILVCNGPALNNSVRNIVLASNNTRGVQTSYAKRHEAYLGRTGVQCLSATWDILYVNGVKVVDTVFNTADWGANMDLFALFARGDANYWTLGSIFDVRLYSSALTADEIAANNSVDKKRFNLASQEFANG